MRTNKHSMIALATALFAWNAFAQSTNSTNSTNISENLFPVNFSAICQSLNGSSGRIVRTRITTANIIAQALGLAPGQATLARGFALVYNADQDSLQVVNTNQPGTVVDVLHFGGGAAIADNRQLDRLTFLFLPGQTNEFGAETNVIGSAVITERANTSGRPNILGRLQYFLSGGNVLGQTNSPSVNTNTSAITPGAGFVMTSSNIVFDSSAQICVGTFTTGHGHPFGMVNVIGGNTNTPGTLIGTTNGGATTGSTNTSGTNGP